MFGWLLGIIAKASFVHEAAAAQSVQRWQCECDGLTGGLTEGRTTAKGDHVGMGLAKSGSQGKLCRCLSSKYKACCFV